MEAWNAEIFQGMWDMPHAEDVGMMSHSPGSIKHLVEVLVNVCMAFGLTVSEANTRSCACTERVRQRYNSASTLPAKYIKRQAKMADLGVTITDIQNISLEMARRVQVSVRGRYHRYGCELYD